MANIPGSQPDVKFCPACKAEMENVMPLNVRPNMKDPGYHSHSYLCSECNNRFEINQHRQS